MALILTLLLSLTLWISTGDAKDLGVYGFTIAIAEEDLLHFIQEKIQHFSQQEQQALKKQFYANLYATLQKPMEIQGLKKAKTYRVFYVDPSIKVERDIFNHQGELVVKKDTVFNPLSQVKLDQTLIFFDATDLCQLAWAKSQEFSAKWILVKGQPFKLESELERPIYFDQGGVLVKKFGIRHLPARLTQESMQLKIEEIPVKEEACAS